MRENASAQVSGRVFIWYYKGSFMRNTAVILLVVAFAGAVYVSAGRPPSLLLLGQIGIGASVPANPYNTLAEQLTDWEGELGAREQSLNEREALVRESQGKLNRILGSAVAVIALLLGLNFYLDWHRRRRPEQT